MSQDIFNYQRTRSGEHLISSDYSIVTIGSANALFRDASIQYGHKVRLEPELGSHEMYFVTGQAEGSCSASRSLGKAGFLNGINPGGSGDLAKGSIASLDVDISSTENVTGQDRAGIDFKSVVNARGIVLESVNFSLSARALEVAEGLQLRIATLVLTN